MITSKNLFTSFLLLSTAALVKSQSRDDEQDEAQITDPVTECTAYDYPPMDALSDLYPEIWVTATIVSTDTYAQSLYDALSGSIPDIAPKGNRTDSETGVTYNITSDPDCWWTETLCTTPKISGLPDDIVSCPEPYTWGLTYDDGPNCSHNIFYDYLLSINQKATLFYIGSNIADWPLEGQRGLADGHEICVHTWSHPYMTALTNEEVFAELYYTKKIIKDVIGITVSCWRPPFGDVDDRVRYIANALGLATIVWLEDTDDYDWTTIGLPAVDERYETILGMISTYSESGVIVLSHELDNETMSEAEKWLPNITSTFKNVMPIGVCHNNTNPYLEGTYTYPNAEQWIAGTRMYSAASSYTGISATDASVSGFLNIVSGVSVTGTPVYATPLTTDGISASSSSSSSSGSVSVTATGSSSTASSTGSSGSSSGSTSGAERVGLLGVSLMVASLGAVVGVLIV